MATNPSGSNRPTRPGTAPRATSTRPVAASAAAANIEEAGEPAAVHTGTRVTRSQQVLQLEGRDKKINMIYYISIGVIVVLLGVLGMLAMNKTERDKRAKAEREEAVAAAIKSMRDLHTGSPNDYGAIARKFEELTKAETAPLYDDETPEHLEAKEIYNQSLSRKETERAKKEHTDRLDRLEKEVLEATKLDSVRRELPLVEAAAALMGGTYPDRVKALKKSHFFHTLKRLFDEAIAAETAAGNDSTAALKSYDEFINKFKREIDAGGTAAARDTATMDLYKQLLAKSDALVAKLITPEYIAQIPERDLLSPREDKMWKITEGVTRETVGREMRLKGVPGKEGKPVTGLVTVYGYDPINPWHDYQVELEFTVNQYDSKAKGLELHHRFTPGKRPYVFGFDKENLEPGKSRHITYIVRGSLAQLIEDGKAVQEGQMDHNTSRTGGFAFALENGVDIVISKCLIKVLRPRQ